MIRTTYSIIPLLILSLIFASCNQQESANPTELDIPMTIIAPLIAPVGSQIELTLNAPLAADETPAYLTVLGSYGPQLLRSKIMNGQAWFAIPATMTIRSGSTTLIATVGYNRAEHTIELVPGRPIEPLIPMVGARSIIADANHWAMTVVIPFDQYGNPIAEGTPVEIRSLHPNKLLQVYNPEIEHLLVWQRINSTTTAGRTVISTNIGDIYGPEGILLEVPGWPVPFTITADPPSLPADGFQLMTLRTSLIHDQHGNILPDGTQITFIMRGVDNQARSIPTQIVDGVAETFIETPKISGQYEVRATMLGLETEPLLIDFTEGPAIGRFPLEITIDNEGSIIITAGPIIGNLEQYVPDGTTIHFDLTDPNGHIRTFEAVTDQGYGAIRLRRIQLTSGQYIINATAGSGSGKIIFNLP